MSFFKRPGDLPSDMDPSKAFRNGLVFGAALWLAIGASCSAFAQTSATGVGQAAAGADASAGAQSGSAAVVNQNYYQSGESRTAVTYGGGTDNTTRNIIQGGTQDTYRATIRNTPDAFAPNISGGTNGCLVGVSGALSVPGFGSGLGINWSDSDCERRQLAALTFNMGNPQLAGEILCASSTYREARQRIGQPCTADRQPTANAQAQTVAVYTEPRQVVGGGAPPVVATRPDWCYTASPAERRRYPVCS